MASDLKEMKYRRRIGAPVVDEPGQCSDQRGVDWAMLKQDPVELLRKLDELRDQITRSCEIIGQPRERRRVSRRALSMLPEYPELPLPPPAALGHEPGYYHSRYAGRCEPGLPPSYPLRPGHGERYVRRSSGRYRQCPARQWDNCGSGHGNYRQNVCLCAHCLHGQRTVAPEEHIPMARYFAGQHECYRFERSPSVSSDYDRRSVASSLYSNRSVSKRRAEYFRKKAEHLCRPARGAAPFIVCSSCYQLLELPPEKCMGRKQSRLQCGSCSEIISFKLEEVKVSPFVPQSSVPMSKTLQSSNDQMTRDLECEHQDDGNATLYNLQERSSVQHNIDFADDNSLSSTISHDRTDKGCGSNRSIQSKAGGLSLSPSRYGDVESPKDILCQRDADCQVEPSVGGPVSPQCPVLEDKLVDPYCSQEKDDSVVDQSTSKRCGLSSKRDYYASISMRSEQKSKEDDKDGLEDGSISEKNKQKSNKDMNERNEQKSKEDMNERNKQKSKEDTTKRDTDSLEDGSMSKKYEQKSKEDGAGSLEDGRMSKKYENKRKEDNIDSIEDGSMGEKSEQKSKEDDTGSLEDGSMIKKYEQKNKKEDADILEDGSMGKMYGYKRKEDDTGSIEDGSMGKKYEQKSKEDDMASLDDGSVSKKYKQESKQDDRDGLEAESISKTYVQNNKDDNNSLICDSASKRCDRKNTEENGQLQHPYTEDANVLVETESSVTGRTNSGFSHGSSEVGLDEDQSSTGKSGDSSFFAGFLKKGFKDLSLFNQSVDSVKVSINGHPISERALKKAEKKAGPVDPGSYWYDYRAGFWGVIGRECIGIIPPFIREFNYPMPKNCASGNTGVFVNGRELHQKDLDLLVGRGLPRISGKSYSIEISGNVTDETSGKKLRSLGKLAPTIEKLKRGFGMHVPEEIS